MSRLVLISLIAGIVAAIVADRKGRNWAAWGALCAVFPILLVVVLLLPPVLARGTTKKCPHCAEIIRHDASLCKHCGRELPIDMLQCPNCQKFVPDRNYCIECHRNLRGGQ